MLTSPELVLPPVDGSVPVLPGFVDFHAVHNADQPFFVFPFPDTSSDDLRSVSFLEFAHATHRVAHSFRPGRTGTDGDVIAIVVNCDTLLYHALVAGLVRAGLVPFPMSPRNNAPAIASMMERTKCHRIIAQHTFGPVMEEIRSALPANYDVHVDALPVLADIFPSLASTFDPPPSAPGPYPPSSKSTSWSDVVLYLHSSGSTGHPKPVPQTHTTTLHWCRLPLLAECRKRGLRWGCMMLPPFHVMGISAQLYAPLVSGQPTSLFPPRALISAPPVVPTPQNTIETARKTRCNAIESVPAFIEAWAHNEEDIKFLASLQALIFAGGPLSHANGAKLVAGGVRLFACYGATEMGTLTCLFDDDVDSPSPAGKTRGDWEWMQLPENCNPRWIPQGDGTYELQLLTCPTHQPSVENLPNGEHGYATSDLWIPHPTKPGLWRVVGRNDDVIVLGTGEKTVPIPQENHIIAHPWVAGALMFGRGHPQVGVLIEPQPGHQVESGDENALVNFRNVIWPQVEEANHFAAAFSRIFKEMILVADSARPFVRAAKGTAQRKKTLELYAREIDQLYKTIEDSRDAHGIAPPTSWNASDIRVWLSEHAAAINGGQVPAPDKDLFEQGFDSLSATFLRNRIIGALRESPDPSAGAAAQHVQPNLVFQNPTLASLAQAVERLVHPHAMSSASQSPGAEIDAMVTKFTVLLPSPPARSRDGPLGNAVVLLTGTTGNLGAHLLSRLLADPRVNLVYALNRGENLAARQRDVFELAELPVPLLYGEKLVLVAGDFSREDHGLEQHLIDEISASVTHIIHNAWRVDFNLALASFETHITAAVRLLNMAPSAHYLFTSSVSVAAGWRMAGRGPVPETPLHDSSVAAKTSGYGMSKYVIEELLAQARSRGATTTSLRIGQISGASQSGAWNTTDWVPSIVKSSIHLGAMPELHGVVSWLPMDAVAGAAVDAAFAPNAPDLINVVHPKPVRWRDVLSSVNAELRERLPFVPLEEWVGRLRAVAAAGASAEDLESAPGIKLLEYFSSLATLEKDARDSQVDVFEVGGLPVFETTKAQGVSPTLTALRPLGEEDAKAWVRYWRKRSFIP